MAEIDPAEWAALKSYMHLEELEDSDEDCDLIRSMYFASVNYLAGAGISRDAVAGESGGLDLYLATLRAMTLDQYDNRGSVSAGSAAGAAVAVRDWINQLKAICMEGYL